MKIFFLHIIILSSLLSLRSQDKMFTRSGRVSFISQTSIINIEGTNNKTICFLNIKTGEIVAGMAMKQFEFTLPLAEEHFNENYVESDKFPNAKLSGKIVDFNKIDLKTLGKKNVEVIGKLTFHGVTKEIKISGILEVKEGKYIAECEFEIQIDDYNIKVPKLVEDKVAKTIPVKVFFELLPYTGK